jgi:thiamine biosynthesis lipoprotein
VHFEQVMGTVVTFDVRTPAPASAVMTAVEEAVRWLHWVDGTFSTYRPGSEVNRFDRGELPAGECSQELRAVIALCLRFNKETDGFFDAWAGGSFDPSGVVKGWSIERASEILAAHGLSDHLVDGGGDLRLRGSPGSGGPWQVGVRHPFDKSGYSATLSVREGAVATSGTYERGLHVVDPFTGRPATDLVSVTVVGAELVVADAYATAALAMGFGATAWLAGLSGYESQVVSRSGRGWSSPGFKALSAGLAAGVRPAAALATSV